MKSVIATRSLRRNRTPNCILDASPSDDGIVIIANLFGSKGRERVRENGDAAIYMHLGCQIRGSTPSFDRFWWIADPTRWRPNLVPF